MAVKQASGFITEEKPQSITQQSSDQGLGTPESPVGGSIVPGSTTKQQDMVGTPAQQKNAQQIRQERDQGTTLEQKERYEQKPVTQPFDQAKDKAQTLAQLGPVKSRVQSLIEQRVQETTAATAQLSANEAKIAALPREQQEIAKTALDAYLANPNEETLQSFYNIVGKEQLEGDGITGFLSGEDEAIASLAQGSLGGVVTLDQLDIGQLGVDLSDIEAQLGLEPGTAAGMTLDQLDSAIDQIEAQELNQVELIRAQLADGSLPPQQRQQLLEQLGAMGAAGMTGLEDQIDQLDAQIAAADTMEIGGITMSLEEALGDEGISATIKNAVSNPEYLDQLKNVPGYESLGQWIDSNKQVLESLVYGEGGVADTATDFLEVQEKYSDVKESLGADGSELLQQLFPDVDWSQQSVLSGDMEDILSQVEGNSVYQVLSDNEQFLTEAKNNPEFLSDLKVLDTRGFDQEQMVDIMDTFTDTIKQDDALQAILGGDELPEDVESWEDTQAIIERYEDLDPSVVSTAHNAGLLEDGVIDLDDLEVINESEFGPEIMEDIISNRKQTRIWERDLEQADDPVAFVKKQLFEDSEVSARDLTYALNYGSKEAKAAVQAVFDLDGDGIVTEQEMNDPQVVEKAKQFKGLGADTQSMIDQEGAWDETKGSVAGVTSNLFEQTVIPKIQEGINTNKEYLSSKKEQAYTGLTNVLEYSGLNIDDYEGIKGSLPKINEMLALRKKLEALPVDTTGEGLKIAGTTYMPSGSAQALKLKHEYENLIKSISEETGVDVNKIKGIKSNIVSGIKRNQKQIDFYDGKIDDIDKTYDEILNMDESELSDLFDKWGN